MIKPIVMLMVCIFLFSCSYDKDSGNVCTWDKDCVPATCCHATDTVNRDSAPDCSEIMCTTECAKNTIDCGQGEISCVSGECKVKLIE